MSRIRIDRRVDTHRGYVDDERSLASIIGVLVTTIAVWMLFYLLSLVGPAPAGLERPPAGGASGLAEPAPVWALQGARAGGRGFGDPAIEGLRMTGGM